MNLRLATLLLLFFSISICPLNWQNLYAQSATNQSAVETGDSAKHLFILSGQSNMAGLKPEESFTPTVEARFGAENVIVVKDAHGGQPIRRWHKKWKLRETDNPKAIGDLYDRLLAKVRQAIQGQELASVTFLWMQGERDAREKNGELYLASLEGLLQQLRSDLQREDIHLVVGRLSDFDLNNKRYPDWSRLRELQVKFAEARPNREWVDTDDLNDGVNRKGKPIQNDLHYSAEGYRIFGERLAKKAILLISRGQNSKQE